MFLTYVERSAVPGCATQHMRSSQSNIDWYREEAARLREAANTVHDEGVRWQLVDIARQYDVLADHADMLLRRARGLT
jgi:cytolysin (calcineurin-like family phosphatase)